MACDESCVYYKTKGVSGACRNCSDYIDENKPKFELGKVDVFKLAKLLREKEQKNKGK